MNSQTEKMLSTGLTLVRDAGSAAVEKLADSKVGTSLAKAVPKAGELVGRVKQAATLGAGLAIARRGGKAALAAAKKNPVAMAAGAVALAGLGVAVAVARKRKKDREAAAANGAAKPKRVSATNMRSNGAAAPAKKAPAKRAARARKPASASTH
jgi:predicted phage tail protein